MAEPIGIASGLLALAAFAFQSSVSLYQLVESFQSSQRNVRQLKEELQALDGVLQVLQEAAAKNRMLGAFQWAKDKFPRLGEVKIYGEQYCWIQEHDSRI
jgi:hypothetical protein